MTSKNPDAVKTWQLIELEVGRDAEEFAGVLAFELGATGIVTLEERVENVKIGAYFDKPDAVEIADSFRAGFARAGKAAALRSVAGSSIADQDWMQKWKEGFEEIEIGTRLIVAPSWKLPIKTEGRIVVQIDPGMAFGTGTHETTRMCLEAIEAHWRGGSLLDVGTGTAILSIAAALLEPGSRVTAIDIDPQAVEVARENVAINNTINSVEVLEGGPREFYGRSFDMAVANLTAEVIISLLDELAGCVSTSGLVVLSGILTTLEADVETAAARTGLTIVERRQLGEWSALVAQKN